MFNVTCTVATCAFNSIIHCRYSRELGSLPSGCLQHASFSSSSPSPSFTCATPTFITRRAPCGRRMACTPSHTITSSAKEWNYPPCNNNWNKNKRCSDIRAPSIIQTQLSTCARVSDTTSVCILHGSAMGDSLTIVAMWLHYLQFGSGMHVRYTECCCSCLPSAVRAAAEM